MPATSIDYSRQLNPAQFQAVTTSGGPALIVAGAGSGKTRTLVYRVAWLVEQGVDPESILLLTFTRRAAADMIGRAAAMLDQRCRQVVGGTFHWLANRVLRRYGRRLSFEPEFSIVDRGDSEDVINLLLSELGFREQNRNFPRKQTIASIFSKAVNRCEPLGAVLFREYGQFLEYEEELSQLWDRYGLYKRQNQIMDFDDLLVYFDKLLAEHPDVGRELSSRYRYILVDEYQDTNLLQAGIVRSLAAEHRNVMVVGDDSQAIYAFRGAHFRNILDFPDHFPEAALFKLEENYRSTQPILDVANAIIHSAREKYTKCLYTRRPAGPLPLLLRPGDEGKQSEYVCERVQELLARGIPLRELAVLFRASYHSFDLEVALSRAGIPFVKYGGVRFVESAHIKDVLAHLRVLQNPWDRLSWNRLLLLVDQVGAKRAQEIIACLGQGEPGWRRLAAYAEKLPAKHDLHRLVRLFDELSRPEMSVSGQVRAVRSYYEPWLVSKYDNYPRRLQELDYLQDWAGKYERLEDFLADVTLDPPTSSLPENHPHYEKDHLVLSTIHSAKGLEWRGVFVISVVEGRLPAGQSFGNEEMLEEEQRLLYVAVTRAKDYVFLCAPQRVYDRRTGFRTAPLSPFLRNLPGEIFAHHPPGEEDGGGEGWIEPEVAGFSPGDTVRHPFFGRGRVLAVADKLKVRIQFEDGRTRLLHLDFAPLERLGG